MDTTSRYMVSLNLGKPNQYTALCVIEEQRTPFELKVRDLQRFPPGTPLPDILAKLVEFLSDPKTKGRSRLAVDVSGAGTIMGRNLRKNKEIRRLVPAVYSVTVTSGGSSVHGHEYMIPKIEIGTIINLGISGTGTTPGGGKFLRIAKFENHETLLSELQNFNPEVKSGVDPMSIDWREGAYDDQVLAVGVGCWLCYSVSWPLPTPVSIGTIAGMGVSRK